METFLIKALQLIVSLSILVVIHEFGHFLFARLFKIRVEKFYLFFNPWFSLFKFKPKNSETEYGIGWLPLGGYVKIAGMIDESMDKEQMAKEPQEWEFRSKPAWQRLLVMVGGVLFNFILALIIYSMMLFTWGDTYIPMKNVKNGMDFSQTAQEAGFKQHDILITADGKDLNLRAGTLSMNTLMLFMDAEKVLVQRDGQQVEINMPDGFADNVIANKDRDLMSVFTTWTPAVVGSVVDSSAAQQAGLMAGDSIVKINNVAVTSFAQIQREVRKNLEKNINVSYHRGDSVLHTASMQVNKDGIIGIGSKPFDFKPQTDNYSFFASFPAGVKLGIETLKSYVAQIRFLFSKEGLSNLGGFGAIGSMFAPTWNWEAFWSMTAFLSIVLAFMNILPIPALDGGHILFLLYEVITRRKPSEKFLEYAQLVGMVILFALLIFANGNDIFRAIFK